MKRFNVLDRGLNLHRHYLLEASAGTGKTFSIQNIVVRLLIEPCGDAEPLLLQDILVVTFTRAATRDLRLRIRSNIEQAVDILHRFEYQGDIHENAPDYLKGCIEQGEESVQKARKYLQQALFTFDQAQIFTIHSFCARMLRQFALESDMGFHYFTGEEPLPYTELMGIIRDFFRTEVRLEEFCPAQLDLLLKGDAEQKKLLKAIQTGFEFPDYPPFKKVYLQFVSIMEKLKVRFDLTSEKMIADFNAQAPFYKNHASGVTKKEIEEKAARFSLLFDQTEWSVQDLEGLIADELIWVKALNPQLIKGKKVSSESLKAKLAYPELTETLKELLYPLIEEAAHFPRLLLRMASNCRKLLRRFQYEEEKLSPDDMLRKMDQALNEPQFLSKVQSQFHAAIIDEFQDTDPVQWKIFRRLFLPDAREWKGYLYLVGDPKQSIYSFRQADIYTYLAAAQALGESHCFSLDVNYRSRPHLVEALNRLFSNEDVPHFIPLPKHYSHLPYQQVKASQLSAMDQWVDERGAVHFFIADGSTFKKAKLKECEQHIFFPFIAQEIIRLKKQKGLQFHQFAVLVRDRYQALDLAEFFEKLNIPYQNQRGTSLSDSPALQALIDLVRAVLRPHDRGAMGAALGSPLMGWSHEEMKQLKSLESMQVMFQRFRMTLIENGFAYFFQEMLQYPGKLEGMTVQEQLLSREGGQEFLRDLQQIADLVVDYQYHEWSSPEGIIPFLDQFHVWEKNEDDRVKRFQDPAADGIKILTLHSSKGLEFEIVFALGLVNRYAVNEDYIPIEAEGKFILTPLDRKDTHFIRYCEENDAEKMRQLYVALTRAKTQLYIPVALHLPAEQMEWGEASPMDLFLARLKHPITTYEGLYERLRVQTGKNLSDFVESMDGRLMTYSIHSEMSCPVLSEDLRGSPTYLSDDVYPPMAVQVTGESMWMSSFTSLNRQVKSEGDTSLVLRMDRDAPAFLIGSAPSDFECRDKSIHTLPSSSETGVLIHHILEKVHFPSFRSLKEGIDAFPLVHPFVERTPLKGWSEVVGHLIFNTLRTPLFVNEDDSFCLADLESEEYYSEIPFIYPYSKEGYAEEVESGKGLMKGTIDFLFYHKQRYYFLDWKTNWLGEHVDDYHHAAMQFAMQENGYFLQASLYKEAVKRYLKLIDDRPFEECFGGMFYLFLRGMEAGKNTGIYVL